MILRPTLLILAALILLCYEQAFAARGPAPVDVQTVVAGSIPDELPLVGSVIPRRTSAISPQVAGLIVQMHVEQGDEVQRGDTLFSLDPALAEIAVQRAQAQRSEAAARLTDAARQLAEARPLHAEGHVSNNAFETLRANVAIAQATHARSAAELAREQELLQRHSIRAPFDGAIVARSAEIGQWVNTGAAVLQLAEVAVLRVEVRVPQQRFAAIRVGSPASIAFEALGNAAVSGVVSARIPSGRDTARTLPIWIDVDNANRQLAPGMSARVQLAFEENNQQTLIVPADALIRRSDEAALVWRVAPGASGLIAEPAAVIPGRSNGAFTEVQGDVLRAGDRVVVRGNESLRPQQAVQVARDLSAERQAGSR